MASFLKIVGICLVVLVGGCAQICILGMAALPYAMRWIFTEEFGVPPEKMTQAKAEAIYGADIDRATERFEEIIAVFREREQLFDERYAMFQEFKTTTNTLQKVFRRRHLNENQTRINALDAAFINKAGEIERMTTRLVTKDQLLLDFGFEGAESLRLAEKWRRYQAVVEMAEEMRQRQEEKRQVLDRLSEELLRPRPRPEREPMREGDRRAYGAPFHLSSEGP